MVHLFGIYVLANRQLSVMPLVLIVRSGYTIGAIISKLHKVNTIFLRDFIYGNMVVNFLFISGFMFFGVLTYEATEYFTAFTYILVGLSILGIHLLLKKLITIVKGHVSVGGRDLSESTNVKISKIKSLLLYVSDSKTTIFIFGLQLFLGNKIIFISECQLLNRRSKQE